MKTVKAKQAQRKSKGADNKDEYWLKWDDAERRECVVIYVKRDQGRRLGAISNLDAACSAGNYVYLSKLDPHHTLSSSGVSLNKESRP